MKKLIYIPTLTLIVIFCLQGLWISKIHHTYINQSMQIIEQIILSSIQKELALRSFSPYIDPNAPKIIIKDADNMTTEEHNQLKGDTLNLDLLTQNNIGSSVLEIITQFQQDELINYGSYIQLDKLDSIFNQELKSANIHANYCILSYNKDTIFTESIGVLSPKSKNLHHTALFPIGTKGRQFIQVKTAIPLSSFLREMLYILLESILLASILLACVIYLIIIIREKDKLFKQREASVNGTVHDLKSPLNGIITLMSYLKKKNSDSSAQILIESTCKQTRKLINEIESLLITARKDRQKIYLQKTETDLIQLVSDTSQDISTQYTMKTHQIKIETQLKELNLMLDPLYITNVIRNLIENALKYSDEKVEITIGISQYTDQAILTVRDNGWGISPKYQKKIFTQFFQVPREQMAHQRGYGIGLAYAKYIMEAHGGDISVESIPQKGSTFTCRFPLK
ncbi:sensor histidine kinase [Phocaeicola sp.]